jgi:hypothetical protein
MILNSELFKRLHGIIGNLNVPNVEVLFWQVLREMNKEADKLANQAFNN